MYTHFLTHRGGLQYIKVGQTGADFVNFWVCIMLCMHVARVVYLDVHAPFRYPLIFVAGALWQG
jgi:hypothetical protein